MNKKKPHYAWIVMAACMIFYYGAVGVAINTFNVYSPFILRINNFTNTQISLIMTFRNIFNILAVGMTAKLYLHFPVRRGLTVFGLTIALGYAIMSFAHSFPLYLVGISVVGIGYGFSSMVAISILLGRWFRAKKTLAISLISAMTGLGTIGAPTLIARTIEQRSLHDAMLIEAAVIAATVLIPALFIRERPDDVGLSPYGAGEKSALTAKAKKERRPLGFRNLVLVYLMLILCTMTCSAGWQVLSLHAAAENFPTSQVALCVTVAGTALMLAKLVFGGICDRLTLKKTSLIYLAVLFVSCIMLTFMGKIRWLLYPAMALFGGAISTITIGCVTWADDWFPPEQHDTMVARFQMLYSCGSLGTSLLPGVIADRNGGSYVPFFWLCALSVVLMVVIMLITYKAVAPADKA